MPLLTYLTNNTVFFLLLSKKSLFLKETLGSELHKAFIAIKEMEYNKVASAVTELDIELYLDSI